MAWVGGFVSAVLLNFSTLLLAANGCGLCALLGLPLWHTLEVGAPTHSTNRTCRMRVVRPLVLQRRLASPSSNDHVRAARLAWPTRE